MRSWQSFTSSWAVRFGTTAAIVLTVVTATTTANASDRTIRTRGTEDVHINSKIFSNLRFSPGNANVRSGEMMTLDHDDETLAPHTLSIVDAGELPGNIDEVFGCGAPGTICDEVFSTVGPEIVDDTVAQFVDVGGGAGLDARLDTIWLPAGTSISVPVSAAPGTTLSYFCAIHAWMQGDIKVS